MVLLLRDFMDVVDIAVGGKVATKTIEGRENYNVRLRYLREKRDNIEALKSLIIPVKSGAQIPLEQLAEIVYRTGPMVIKSEDTFLTSYVLFDKKNTYAEMEVVEKVADFLQSELANGYLTLPSGVSYSFAGNYENQVRSQKTLSLVLPLALLLIFLVLYIKFKNVQITLFIFSAIFIALSGGMIMLYAYSTDWFLNFPLIGDSLRELFNIRAYHLSVAVWVGFLALFGIASDDGVVMATYLEKTFKGQSFNSIEEVRYLVEQGAMKRVRPCIMTTATTLIALLPIITSQGRGSDVMVPMAIPVFGGMVFAIITMFVVPVAYSWYKEQSVHLKSKK